MMKPEKTAKTPESALDSTQIIDPSVSGSFKGISARSKSSQRLRYEAEVELIRKKLGDLEAIRETLGLTQRKMAQLLLVDPSAWTRWTKGGESAPPHIYRMLQWYLALQDKYPALDAGFWLSAVAKVRDPDLSEKSRLEIEKLNQRYSLLHADFLVLKEQALQVSPAKSETRRTPQMIALYFSVGLALGFAATYLALLI
jgi:transcriptional regulator with XRE-family HTH domain